MPVTFIELAVSMVELFAKFGPGLVESGVNLFNAINSNGELSDEQKAALIARVQATRAAVAAYEPRPQRPTPPGGD